MTNTVPLAALRTALAAALIERSDESDSILVALIAREHVLLVGPPGTAKSHAARSVALGIRGCRYVERLLAPTTPPEALWGPISLAALRADRYEHVTTGTVADAELVFLDEVGRASPAILDTLLHLLGPERQALIGTVQVQAPLIAAVGAANTWPEDAAMLDRWLVRRVVKPISRGSLGRLMWDVLPGVSAVADLADLTQAHADAMALPVSSAAREALADAVSELASEGIRPSDRRLRASVRIARASAVLNGAAEVEPEHLTALADVLWNRPEDAGKAGDIIRRVANPTLARLTQLLANADEVVETAKAASGDAAVRIESIQKLNEMLKESEGLRGKKGTYDKNGRAAHITTYIRRQAAELQAIALGMDPAKATALMNMDDDA